MSSFICEYCGTHIIDTDKGYITGCEHYRLPERKDMTTTTFFKIPTIVIKDNREEPLNNYKFLSNEEIPECCGSCLNRTKLKCSELNDEICIWAVCEFYRRKEF